MKDKTYQKFVNQWKEVTDIPPQTVGPLTPLYKKTTKYLKVAPLPILIFFGVLLAVGLYIVFGPAITLLVSILQRGF